MKFWVVPELSDRRAMVIFVAGSFTPGLSAAIAASFQVVMLPWKIFAMVGAVAHFLDRRSEELEAAV